MRKRSVNVQNFAINKGKTLIIIERAADRVEKKNLSIKSERISRVVKQQLID